MKPQELHQKTVVELEELAREWRSKLTRHNFSLGMKNLKDTSQIGKERRGLARILTILNLKKKLANQ